ncbi:LysR family transcriptional regulator [Shewanella sp. C31]|nr:LysR family transcriptional regulator [Shewanella electrica]
MLHFAKTTQIAKHFFMIRKDSQLQTINARNLELFVAVYDSGSFSVVARQLNSSPSTISRAIQQLEDALGQQLFYRNTRALVPTEAGRMVINYARNTVEQLDELHAQLQAQQQQLAGVIRINAPIVFSQRHIVPWLKPLMARYPQLSVELQQTDDFIDPLQHGTDLTFRIGRLNDSRLQARIFGYQHYHLAASAAYLEQHGQPTSIDALQQHDCLVYHGSYGLEKWYFAKPQQPWQTFPQRVKFSANNAESLLQACLDGLGLVMFPDWLIGEYLQSGQLRAVMTDHQWGISLEQQSIAAIYPAAKWPSQKVRAVIDFFAEQYGEPPYWQYK